jgi:hypothetical protein
VPVDDAAARLAVGEQHADGLLQLVRAVTDQEDDADVGFPDAAGLTTARLARAGPAPGHLRVARRSGR